MNATATTLRAATIGAGKISEEHLRFLSASPRARLVGVCDLSPAVADFAARKFNAQAAYTDYANMLADARADVVHILTPAATHPRLVSDCLNAVAHVIVEKPVAPTHGQFMELWNLAQSKISGWWKTTIIASTFRSSRWRSALKTLPGVQMLYPRRSADWHMPADVTRDQN